MSEDVLRLFALWALAHEIADDAWKAAVDRGRSSEEGAADPMDALAALVAEEKDRLREALESGELTGAVRRDGEALEELTFEVGEVRGRLESIETTLDALTRRLDA